MTEPELGDFLEPTDEVYVQRPYDEELIYLSLQQYRELLADAVTNADGSLPDWLVDNVEHHAEAAERWGRKLARLLEEPAVREVGDDSFTARFWRPDTDTAAESVPHPETWSKDHL